MEIKKIFVAGAGLMGGGIAQVCAQAGYQVTMRDVADEILQKSLKAISWSVGKFVEKGKVAGTVDEIMGRLTVTTDLAAASDADFVFEANIENLDAKRKLFAEFDTLCPAHTILGTNTSAGSLERTRQTLLSVQARSLSTVSLTSEDWPGHHPA